MVGTAGRKVGGADHQHPVVHHLLAVDGELAIAAGGRGQIDHHRAPPHPLDHGGGHQPGGRSAGDGCGGDHHVGPGHGVGDQLALPGQEFGPLLGGVAAFARSGLERQFHKPGAEALHFLGRFGPHVVGVDRGAEAPHGGDGLQPGHAGPHDQDPGGGYRPGRGHHHGYHPVEPFGGQDGGLVPGQAGLRAEGVHGLGPAGAGHQIKREGGHLPVPQDGDSVKMRGRRKEAHPGGALRELPGFLKRRRRDPNHNGRAVQDRRAAGYDPHPFPLGIAIVAEPGALAGAGLDHHPETGRDQFGDLPRHHGDPALAAAQLTKNSQGGHRFDILPRRPVDGRDPNRRQIILLLPTSLMMSNMGR